MSLVGGCYYASINGTAFGWTQMIPIVFTLVSFVISAITNEQLFVLFSFYLFFPQWIVWCFQYYFQIERPNPICQLYHTWAFPSMEGMYTGAIVCGFFTYAYFWPVYQSWVSYLFIYIFATLSPIVPIYLGYNAWWEVVFSWGFGGFSASAFIIVVYYFMKPKMEYLKTFFIFYNYQDTFIKSDKKGKTFKILKALERVDGSSFS